MVERLFLAVPWGCLQFVIVIFPDHTHLLILDTSYNNIVKKNNREYKIFFTYYHNCTTIIVPHTSNLFIVLGPHCDLCHYIMYLIAI